MKTLFTIIFSLFCSLTFAQQNQPKINKIKQEVGQINKGKNYTTKRLEDEEFLEHMTDNGGSLTGYFKNKQLVKIDEEIGLSSCEIHTTYYLKNNQLIFVYVAGYEAQYDKRLGGPGENNMEKLVMECRFYFDNGKIIKSMLKGTSRCSGQPLESDAKTHQEDCLKYIKLLSN